MYNTYVHMITLLIIIIIITKFTLNYIHSTKIFPEKITRAKKVFSSYIDEFS